MRVLFVDDEPNVLAALKRMLRRNPMKWDVDFACGGEEALKKLAENPFDVVVSDMRMPHMDGAALLNAVKDNYPAMVRLVLSGQSETERVMRAVGPAHQFLSKPCDADFLVGAIQRAHALHGEFASQRLRSLVSSIDSLPSLPKVYTQLYDAIIADDASIDRVADLISQDIAMTSKVLQLVNSSFFGLPHRVTEAKHAVSLLGLERIRPLVLLAGVFSQYEDSAVTPEELTELTDHCLAVASIARQIASVESCNEEEVEDAFLGGMLHDLGVLVLMAELPEEYRKIVERAKGGEFTIWEAEKQVLGCDHGLIGAYLLSLWGLPDPVVEAVSWNHDPLRDTSKAFRPLTAVHAAHAILQEVTADQEDEENYTINEEYIEQLGLEHRLDKWRQCAGMVSAEGAQA